MWKIFQLKFFQQKISEQQLKQFDFKSKIGKLGEAVIVSILVTAIITIATKSVTNDKKYTIYIAGGIKGESEQTFYDIFRDKVSDQLQNLKLDSIPVEIKAHEIEFYDDGDSKQAKDISYSIANDKDTLMVVGHFFSSSTQTALSNYLNTDPPIPVVLTTETTNQILPKDISTDKANKWPVFRLSPTNNSQATKAAEFAEQLKKNKLQTNSQEENNFKIWVVEDNQNSTYSKNLADKFIQEIHEIGNSERDKIKVLLRSSTNSVIPVDVIEILKFDLIYFIGDWSDSLIFIRRINSIFDNNNEVKRPEIILSDSAVNDKLYEQGKNDVEGVLITSPTNAKFSGSNNSASYYASKTANVITKLFKKANSSFDERLSREKGWFYWFFNNKLLNRNSSEDARTVINSIIKETLDHKLYSGVEPFRVEPLKEESEESFQLERDEKVSKIGEIVVTQDGKEKNRGCCFHIWKIKNSQFEENDRY